MKKLILIVIIFCNNITFGQLKSDLSFLNSVTLATVKEATHWGYKECSNQFGGICFRVLQTRDYHGSSRLYIEFINENTFPISFLYCFGQEDDYTNKSKWKTYNRIRLGANEIKHQVQEIDSYKSSFYITIGGVLLNPYDEYYQVSVNSGQKCGYCIANEDDPKCPQSAESVTEYNYESLPFEGDDFTETELGKIKGTIPLSDADKKNAKIDASVQGINLLFQIGKNIKQAVDEKKELQRKEQEELQLQKQQEIKRKNDELALKQKLNTSKVEEKINLKDIVFKDKFNSQTFSSGQIIFKDGSYYEGSLFNYKKSDGKQNKGKFYFANGDKYEGGFLNQKQDGWGTYTWANGQKFTGYFYNGDIFSTGTITFTNNTYKTGYFQRTTDNMGMNFDDELTKKHQTYRSSDGTQLWQIKNPVFISEL